MAGAALIAVGGASTAQAGSAEEAARNKEILAQAYRIWHESRGDSVGRGLAVEAYEYYDTAKLAAAAT
jgi:hypothetical protein